MEEGFRLWANPSSPHAEGRKAREALEDARARVKAALGWEGEVIFTSGASEALAIGLGRAKVDRRIVSAVEHDAVFRAAPNAEVIPIDPQGIVDGDIDCTILAGTLQREGRAVVAIQHINSETGTNQYVTKRPYFSDLLHDANAILLADCSQSAGKMPLPKAEMVVLSAHKLGGPVGIGALLVRDFALLEPVGGHERGYRAGTENLPAALGFAAALEVGGLDNWSTSSEDRSFFREFLGSSGNLIDPGGSGCNYIFSVAHPVLSAQTLLIRLDGLGFAVSAGSACSSGTLKKSRVLEAFGVDDATAARTIRISFGWTTTRAEVERFCEVWLEMAKQ